MIDTLIGYLLKCRVTEEYGDRGLANVQESAVYHTSAAALPATNPVCTKALPHLVREEGLFQTDVKANLVKTVEWTFKHLLFLNTTFLPLWLPPGWSQAVLKIRTLILKKKKKIWKWKWQDVKAAIRWASQIHTWRSNSGVEETFNCIESWPYQTESWIWRIVTKILMSGPKQH